MYCVKKITETLTWVGGNDRRLAMFEGVYSVPSGVSYNSYVLVDEKVAVFDTVDRAVSDIYFENLAHVLGQRQPDYLVIHHMEPDHSACVNEFILRYPDVKIVCNAKTRTMLAQFFGQDFGSRIHQVNEGDVLSLGTHSLTFINAPMVHWPEVMMSYETQEGILFCADAFGHFGALNGAIFADEVDFERDYMDEARRYYTNIVGKYGVSVQNVLKKAQGLSLNYVCPLHGFVWRRGLEAFVEKYSLWSRYIPEQSGVVIAYASIYGNTENAAEILSSMLRERGVRTVMFDVSVTPASNIISEIFKYSHLVLASPTYNTGIFVTMETLVHDIVAHSIQGRVIGFIQNGSWAPTATSHMRTLTESLRGVRFLENTVDIRSAVSVDTLASISAMADEIYGDISKTEM